MYDNIHDVCFVFFFKQKTAYEMRISDWSSDVCSSDLKAAVAALSDEAEICGCNGVSKGGVVACIRNGAVTLDAVRASCKASASCGSCTGLVENLLAVTLGDEYAGERAEKTVRSEEHTSELQSLMRISYAVFCLNKKK